MIIGKRSLAAGEISPALYANTDMVKFAQGLRTLKNAYVQKFGSVQSRAGFSLVRETNVEYLVPPRLIDWEFNDEQTYIIEMGDEYFRFYKNGRPVIVDPKPFFKVDGLGGAGSLVVTSTAHGFADDDFIFIYGLNAIIPDGQYKVADATANTYTLIDTSGAPLVFDCGVVDNIFTAFAGPVLQLTSPYYAHHVADVRYAQNADVMVMTHNNYPVQELVRAGPNDWNWTLGAMAFGPVITAPTGLSVTPPGVFGWDFYVTSVSATGEESLRTLPVTSTTAGSFTLSWSSVADAKYYNVYAITTADGSGLWRTTEGLQVTGDFTSGVDFLIPGKTVELDATNPFNGPDSYPLACGFYEQRLFLGYTNNNVEGVWSSRIGTLRNFELSFPSQSSDPVSFTPWGRKVNAVQHFLDLDNLAIFTKESEVVCRAEPITPTDVQPKVQTYNGTGRLRPIGVDGSAIYVQQQGSIVRDFDYKYEVDGYRGDDLTTFSYHLLDGFSVRDWCYQKTPNSMIWIVRSDGALLSLTYVKEQEILGWARHDVGGFVHSVACVTEGGRDVVYMVVTRSGEGYGYTIERMTDRFISGDDTLKEFVGMDGAVTIDGRGQATSLTITGGTSWNQDESLTITAATGSVFWGDADLENKLFFYPADGTTPVIFTILSVDAGGTFVTATPDRTVPLSMQGVPTVVWGRAVKRVKGLFHLEGQMVSVMGDSFVVASPNNPDYPVLTVTGGELVLPDNYVIIHVGLPITVDVETLDIDLPGSQSVISKKKRVSEVTLQIEKTSGVWVGPRAPQGSNRLEFLEALKIRQDEDYQKTVRLVTGKESVIIRPEWNSNGRVFIRQVDPLPMTILGIFADGDYPFGGG